MVDIIVIVREVGDLSEVNTRTNKTVRLRTPEERMHVLM